MAKVSHIVSIADQRQDEISSNKRGQESREPIDTTDLARATVTSNLTASLDAHGPSEYERSLLVELERGDREIDEDNGHDLESVLAEADRLLKQV